MHTFGKGNHAENLLGYNKSRGGGHFHIEGDGDVPLDRV